MKRQIEETLTAWMKKTAGRMPLLVNGARQVGKTYILRKFGQRHLVQNEILDNYIADMAKYASNADSVKIRACYKLQQ